MYQSNIIMRNLPIHHAPVSNAPPWGRPDQNLIRPTRETEFTRQMSCDVVFGSPQANCMGTGICRISARTTSSPLASERKNKCQSTVGLLFPIEGGKGVALVLTRALLCSRLYKLHLRRGMFILSSQFELPNDVRHNLGLKIKQLNVGSYPVQEAEGFLRVDFK